MDSKTNRVCVHQFSPQISNRRPKKSATAVDARRHSGNDVESDGDSDLDASDDDIKKEDDVDVPEATTTVATNGDEKTTMADEITPTNGEN